MTKSVKWNLSVNVEDGPSLTSSETMDADAVDVVSVEVANGESTVDIQPGELGEVQFVYIKSDLHSGISYKFKDDEDAESPSVDLDKDHTLTSKNLIALFTKSPNKIVFTNSNPDAANIEVVVARSAI